MMRINRKTSMSVAAGVMLLMGAATSRAALLVTEFMPNPSGTDIDREWFEIYNSGATAIDLTGYAVGDGTDPAGTSTGEAMGVFPAGTTMNPGQVFVIAVNANGFNENYGFLPDFEFANSNSTFGLNDTVPDLTQKPGWGNSAAQLAIANTGDNVAILDPSDTILDGANHGSNTIHYSGAVQLLVNQSYERVPAHIDTDSVDDWIVRASGEATPGQVTIPEPASLSLLAMGGLAVLRRRRRASCG